jgi:hypothetical protein
VGPQIRVYILFRHTHPLLSIVKTARIDAMTAPS